MALLDALFKMLTFWTLFLDDLRYKSEAKRLKMSNPDEDMKKNFNYSLFRTIPIPGVVRTIFTGSSFLLHVAGGRLMAATLLITLFEFYLGGPSLVSAHQHISVPVLSTKRRNADLQSPRARLFWHLQNIDA